MRNPKLELPMEAVKWVAVNSVLTNEARGLALLMEQEVKVSSRNFKSRK
jgi:hypothetical protein